MMPQRWLILFGAAFVALAQAGWSQGVLDWRIYGVADGLPKYTCVSVSVTPQGKVLVRNLDTTTITELDGYTVNTFPGPDGVIDRISEDSSGRLWAMTRQGLQEWKNGAWVLHPVSEIAAGFQTGQSRSIQHIPFYPINQGRVVFLLPDHLMEFSTEEPDRPHTTTLRISSQTQLGEFSDMIVARDGSLWISGARGLARMPGPVGDLKSDGEWREYLPPASLGIQNLRELQEDKQGDVTAIAESMDNHQTMIVRFNGLDWEAQSVGAEKISFAWHDSDKVLWAAAGEALFQFPEGRAEKIKSEEISASQYFDLAVEPGGAFWLATSDGLFRYAPPVWRSPAPLQKIDTPIRCLTEDPDGWLWFVSDSGLQVFHNDLLQGYSPPNTGTQSLQTVRALFPLKNRTLLLDAGEQCFQFGPLDGVFRAFQAGEMGKRFKPLGQLKDGSVCIQSFTPGTLTKDYHLNTFDGVQLHPIPFPDPAMGGEFYAVFEAQNGDIWLSGERGVACCRDKKWQAFASTERAVPEAVSGFTELADGKIWCAAEDKIWEFDGRNWSVVRAGFNHINTLLCSHDGSVWVASNSGLYRFWRGAWIENGAEEGLPSAFLQQVYEDQDGRIWAATSHGLSLYHPEADPDPPKTSIRKLASEKGQLFEGGTLSLFFSGQDKWKYTRRDRLLYSYRLDQRDWSLFQEMDTVSFPDLSAGKHYFQVRSMDRNGNVEPLPAQLEFAVALPWYRETRLVLISFAGLAAALFFAALAVNRHRQLLRSYAAVEKKVTERTRELEIANRELLQSQKMKALGTLAAGIAHDFNNILSIIKGSAQIIEGNLENPAKIRTRVDRIKMVVEQGSGIVKAMLGFSRSSDGQSVQCDPNDVVDDTIKLLGDRFLREVEVRFERGQVLPEIQASRDFIQQILLNLIFNAAESMTGRKQVLVTARRITELPAGVVLMPASAAAYVSISVRDFGCGIPPGNMPRIFEPFFTTKSLSARRGTGLGLSMVYELAKKMEAGLAVESVVDQGSTFKLILPIRDLPPQKTEISETYSTPQQQ
jgi:signal transduction histidine kinase/ligand-binding sensor domain-containing protein